MSDLGQDWEQRAASLEVLIALASWRRQSLPVRLAALLDALAACPEPPEFKAWGSEDI